MREIADDFVAAVREIDHAEQSAESTPPSMQGQALDQRAAGLGEHFVERKQNLSATNHQDHVL